MAAKKKKSEPEPLRQGKQFHKEVQKDWLENAEGDVTPEYSVLKPSGRRGRVDVFVKTDQEDNLVAVLEIKASDWDAMKPVAVRRNVKRQIRQIWSYINSQLYLGKGVSPGVKFPKRPQDPERLQIIESLFEEEGIPVVWKDESLEERRLRG